MDELLKTVSSKLLAWLLGIVATLLLGVAGLILNFYTEWKADEAAEEVEYHQDKAIMFDSPEQKEEIKDHTKEALPALEQRLKIERDKDFQQEVLKELKHRAKIDTLNADQLYQFKEEQEKMKQMLNRFIEEH